ncbi:MAG: hypothetical protein BWY86_01070 [Candidatus Aminicenantes bacterium ADurb.Bin508]|nr:MAG: hypothetical protein BWY86_01070 [Candidatus Aminicenantes bacterium ADurb.Bin508]
MVMSLTTRRRKIDFPLLTAVPSTPARRHPIPRVFREIVASARVPLKSTPGKERAPASDPGVSLEKSKAITGR